MPRRTTAIRILLSRITCLLVQKTWVRSGIHLKIDLSTYNIHKMIFSRLSVSGAYFFRPKSCQILKKDLLHVQSWVIKKRLLFWQCDRTSEIISCPSGKFIHPRRLDGLSFQLWWCLFLVCLFVCVFHCCCCFFLVSVQETEKMIQEWDGLTRYLDAVMSRFFKVDNYEVRWKQLQKVSSFK